METETDTKTETSKIKFYNIQISVECCDHYEELFWSEGLVSYLDIKTDKKDLKKISDEMWETFNKDRSEHWHSNKNPQTTIALFENNTSGILYSDFKYLTDVDVIDGVLDTMDLNFKDLNHANFEVFKDEIGYDKLLRSLKK